MLRRTSVAVELGGVFTLAKSRWMFENVNAGMIHLQNKVVDRLELQTEGRHVSRGSKSRRDRLVAILEAVLPL